VGTCQSVLPAGVTPSMPAAAPAGSVSDVRKMSIMSIATPIVMAESAVLKSGHWSSRQ